MIIAAVDVSYSIDLLKHYSDDVLQVLRSLKGPVRVIEWSDCVEKDTTYRSINEMDSHKTFKGSGATEPTCFLEKLPSNYLNPTNSIPFELLVFTDGRVNQYDIRDCQWILKKRSIPIQKVSLYYIGDVTAMNLGFTKVFSGIPQEVHVNKKFVGQVEKTLPDFRTIDYDYIMKDNSFKISILNEINSSNREAHYSLKTALSKLTTRILKEQFEKKASIIDFYKNNDVDGCVSYVKKKHYYEEKVAFQQKMSQIMNLFDKNIDTYSLDHVKDVPKYTLEEEKEPEENDNGEEETEEEEEEEEVCDTQYLTCDILYGKCQLACIPVKKSQEPIWPDKKILKNPFKLLESEDLIQTISNGVEPYTMDYFNTYQHLSSPDISPFTRDALQGVYILHNEKIAVRDMILHNNYVLSTFFQNKLPGKPILWHIIFLYILSKNRLKDQKSILFKEIQFLGEQVHYFVTLTPTLNPPIVEPLNVCFWYIAHSCHRAFPNSQKNLLRTSDYNSGVFLKFYQDVYEPEYVDPKLMPLWQCWFTLCHEPDDAIKTILTHFFHHEKVKEEEEEENGQKDHIILYMDPASSSSSCQESKKKKWVTQLDLQTVLNVYGKFLEKKQVNFYEDLENLKDQVFDLYEKEDSPDLLDHVQINIKTCHPHVICPITQKYWKECIGLYNRTRHSYIRLFKRYCEHYEEYPKNGQQLLKFLDKYLFQQKNKIPECFPIIVKSQMDKVLDIFKEVMETYPCKTYVEISNKKFSEEKRKEYEIERRTVL